MKVATEAMKSSPDHTEARAFEQNAARGVRDVAMVWLLRKLVLPIAFGLLLVIAAAYYANGILAAVPLTLMLVGYVLWVSGVYHRNFLKNAPFRRTRSTNRFDK